MNENRKRTVLVAGAIVLALVSVGAGALIALSGSDRERTEPSAAPPTSSPSSSPSTTPTGSPSPSAPPVTEDGRYFVYVTGIAPRGDALLVIFDLAYLLTGAEGEQAAAEHGDEFANGYYIVNDNPKLRTVPLADHVHVAYIPTNLCCELQRGRLDRWLEAVLGMQPTDYSGKDVPWWITVRSGQVVRIQQQHLP